MLGLLPIPEKRWRRLKVGLTLGAVVLIGGLIFDNDFAWGVGAGMLITGAVALALDRWARGRQAR